MAGAGLMSGSQMVALMWLMNVWQMERAESMVYPHRQTL